MADGEKIDKKTDKKKDKKIKKKKDDDDSGELKEHVSDEEIADDKGIENNVNKIDNEYEDELQPSVYRDRDKTSSIIGFERKEFVDIDTPINKMTVQNILKHLIARTEKEEQFRLSSILKTILRATNYEISFPSSLMHRGGQYVRGRRGEGFRGVGRRFYRGAMSTMGSSSTNKEFGGTE